MIFLVNSNFYIYNNVVEVYILTELVKVRSNMKVSLTVFFDHHDVVHQEFLPLGRIVNKEYYLEVMWCFRQ